MKKTIALLLSIIMLLPLVACGGAQDADAPGYCGTWKLDHVLIEGAEFTASELAVFDEAISEMSIIIKDKGKAYVSSGDGDGDLVDWSETDAGILLDEKELFREGELLRLEVDENEIYYFKKVSDSQVIESNTAPEVNAGDESTTSPSEETTKEPEEASASPTVTDTDKAEEYSYSINLSGIATIEDLETRIDEHLSSSIGALTSQFETLSTEIDTYDKYVDNAERVSEFYQTLISETEQMCIMLYEYSGAYARMILDSDMSGDDKYDAIDGIQDLLYEDACDEIHDEIYEGILEDMNDCFYEGILEDAQDYVKYSDWYDVISDEYNQWYDTSSEVYGLYYDAASEIYSFYYDMASELYSRDYERAEKIYNRFLQKIAKEKGLDTGASNADATFDTTPRTASNVEELESVIDAHISECVQALYAEWETFSAEISTFDKYQDHVAEVESFHTHIEDSAAQLFALICDYGAVYAELILDSGDSAKEMYGDFEDFKDCIYEDACEVIKDEIYEDLLGEIKDYYYEGIISDAKDTVSYGSWSDARSDTYGWWSDARSEVYGNWSDIRGDLYSFYSDIRSELYNGDMEGANDELQDFKEKVDKLK